MANLRTLAIEAGRHSSLLAHATRARKSRRRRDHRRPRFPRVTYTARGFLRNDAEAGVDAAGSRNFLFERPFTRVATVDD
jgi:hypothetical protein